MDLAEKEQAVSSGLALRGAAWAAVFLAAIVAYWPGLGGPFVLDDFSSLGALGNTGGITNWDSFKAFVFNGTAGPTGRPVALLSFLIDGSNWPADPWPFKRTNLVIHLVNGALLGLVTRKILTILHFSKDNAAWIGLASAATWMLHPFLVSTTLYAVQRMAQLVMLFSMAGVATWIHGRLMLATRPARAYLVMTLSLGLFTILATLSKENGALLPLSIGAIELTVFASRGDSLPRLDRRWVAVFLVLPCVLITGYLGYRFFSVDFLEVARPRDFSLYERFLTQARVVADYLQNWFVPKLYTTGVFQDHVIKSTGLLSPVTTIVATIFHVSLIALAVIKRRQMPLLALAILFFYVNHLLESTVLNLELYFEHRNYVSTAFLFLPLIVLLRDKVSRQAGVVIVVAVLLVLAGFTRYSATVWSDYNGMVAASAQKAPTSARAQALLATILFNAGQYDQSQVVLDRAIENIPTNDPLLLVNRLIIRCNLQKLQPAEVDAAIPALSSRPYDPRYLNLYQRFAQSLAENRCPGSSVEQLRPLFAAMLDNPGNTERGSLPLSHVHYLAGFVDLLGGARLVDAERHFRASLEAQPDASSAMSMAALMATAGNLEEALVFSSLALEQLNADSRGVRAVAKVTEQDILQFRRSVQAELDTKAN